MWRSRTGHDGRTASLDDQRVRGQCATKANLKSKPQDHIVTILGHPSGIRPDRSAPMIILEALASSTQVRLILYLDVCNLY